MTEAESPVEAALVLAIAAGLRFLVASVIYVGFREYALDRFRAPGGWWRLLLALVVASIIVGGLLHNGPRPDEDGYPIFDDERTPAERQTSFYFGVFVTLILGGSGIVAGRRAYDDPLHPRSRYAQRPPN